MVNLCCGLKFIVTRFVEFSIDFVFKSVRDALYDKRVLRPRHGVVILVGLQTDERLISNIVQ